MYKKDLPHLVISKSPSVSNYMTTQPGRGKTKIPARNNRIAHGERLKRKFESIRQEFEQVNIQREAISFTDVDGIKVEFRSKADYDLIAKSLEDIRRGIRLLNIQYCTEGEHSYTKAVIFIPSDKIQDFLTKLEDYLNTEKDKNGKPSNANLVNSIEDIKLALLDSFWNDKAELIPSDENLDWCEIWLRVDNKDDNAEVNFFNICSSLNIEYKEDQVLFFPERKVVLVKTNKEGLTTLIRHSSRIAEIRLVKETASFWLVAPPSEQADWAENLVNRLSVKDDSDVAVCVLDTGVNNGHALLSDIIKNQHCFSVKPEWAHSDTNGHGTLMCGTVTYGDLQKCLESQNEVSILHSVESVKLIRNPGSENDKDSYGKLTENGVYYAEIEAPEKKRIICLAITSDKCEDGRPSSWSGSIDKISSGMEDEDKNRRLFIISAGNIRDEESWKAYPDSNISCQIQDPAQAWNALTVGAYTEKDLIADPIFNNYTPLANKGELSPYSSTSLSWKKEWPIKPEIVMEGGNIAKETSEASFECIDDLSLLSLSHQTTRRQFDSTYATSAATAQASWMAAQIQLRYPHFWPETIRALMVHSAEWTEQLQQQFYDQTKTKKDNYKQLLRICGYGVPNINKAIHSASNNLTLISENIIQPYFKPEGSNKPKTKDMHLHEFPWPSEVLRSLPSEAKIKLKITLSYFIEPSPGNIGWKDKYRYQSHALRFAINKPLDTKEEFLKRINKLAAEEEKDDDNQQESSSQSIKWKLGPKSHTAGSIHSDTWEGYASELANCNLIAIYPVIGWWKERSHLKRWSDDTRYSLIVSLETPKTEIDLYTPVEIALKTPIQIPSN